MTTKVEMAAADFVAVAPHVAVADVVRTAEYYRDVLGFDVAGYWDGEEVHRDSSRPALFGIVERGQVSIHLNQGEQARVPSRESTGGYDLYFDIRNVDALAGELVARGAEIIDGPRDRSYGQRELVVRDCNGFVLAFGEPLPGCED
ncbi:MAG TPA: VOC family protein [Longimicrobiales bacterium]|nr:VOC family protein [Longimicrobiales bacterium]